jgi:hypothetical protein
MSNASLLQPSGVLPDKIPRRHRERAAMVYIRQSTPQQVEGHQESTRLQYAPVDRAFQFGRARYAILTGHRIDLCPVCGGSMVEIGLGRDRRHRHALHHAAIPHDRTPPSPTPDTVLPANAPRRDDNSHIQRLAVELPSIDFCHQQQHVRDYPMVRSADRRYFVRD